MAIIGNRIREGCGDVKSSTLGMLHFRCLLDVKMRMKN